MRQTDKEETRNKDKGIGAGTSQLEDRQTDVEPDVQHMPRHWQGSGTRGQGANEEAPGPDEREPGRGNQYGRTGEIAAEQVENSLPEQDGRSPSPQRRDNEQLPKRAGEHADDIPTPTRRD